MRTKCPKQPGHFPGKEDHRYTPCLEIKPHLKNVWQSPKNPLAHPKCIIKEYLYLEKTLMDFKGYIFTL
jgi:hypothetical protein